MCPSCFLALLIFRVVSIEFRSKEPMAWWRKTWDTQYMVSSSGLAIALGAVLANVLRIAHQCQYEIMSAMVGTFEPVYRFGGFDHLGLVHDAWCYLPGVEDARCDV